MLSPSDGAGVVVVDTEVPKFISCWYDAGYGFYIYNFFTIPLQFFYNWVIFINFWTNL
jgi:hypothetical protein